MSIKDGAVIAALAASLLGAACKKEDKGSGPTGAPTQPAAEKGSAAAPSATAQPTAVKPAETPPEKTVAKIHCLGINECKGKSLCVTDKSGCAGQNACKGQGWIDVSKEECDAKGGKETKGM